MQPDSADAELKWGLTLALQRRPEAALPHLRRAIELEPENPGMREAMGRVLLEAGRRTEAMEQFEALLRLDPNQTGAREALDRLRSLR
jgi:Flp pilus assembly protein TadD